MDLPDGYTARPAAPDDVAACCALVIAVDVEEYGEPDYEEADVRDDWDRRGFDLARDTWLLDGPDGRLVGYATAWDKRPHELVIGEAAVHPDAPDLYPWLVGAISRRTEEHATESGRAVAHVYCSEPNRRRADALTAAGYEVVRVFRRMVADLSEPLPAPEPGPGVTIRPATPDDHPTIWNVQREAFAQHFDYVEEAYEQWHRRFVASETHRPEYWWVAEADGALVGVLIGQRHEENGWVKTLGVLPSARGRGVGTALLLTAFAAFRADGAPQVGLGVDSDNVTGAVGLYERIGMRADRQFDLYERVFTR
ncbi:MAG TPA: GNAT family N-acetyltransferase [Mycobacteriales bacterium]|jgi:mycothiol synthase|nr:GNAT family N-acetyltransferase [Mycobacteriales bacterium]